LFALLLFWRVFAWPLPVPPTVCPDEAESNRIPLNWLNVTVFPWIVPPVLAMYSIPVGPLPLFEAPPKVFR